MDKIYNLIYIDMPVKDQDQLHVSFVNEVPNIESIGLYTKDHKKVLAIAEDTYHIEDDKLILTRLSLPNCEIATLLIGAVTDAGLCYFEFSRRQQFHLWDVYFDFGRITATANNRYLYLNTEGKMCFKSGNKLEIDTNDIRIPYNGVVNKLTVGKKQIEFSIEVIFDKNRFDASEEVIRPQLVKIGSMEQSEVEIAVYQVNKRADNHFEVAGVAELPETVSSEDYCFAVSVGNSKREYLLNVFQMSKELFKKNILDEEKIYKIQRSNHRVTWYDRQGIVINVLGTKNKNFNRMNLIKRFIKNKPSENELKKIDDLYDKAAREWVERSSLRRFV